MAIRNRNGKTSGEIKTVKTLMLYVIQGHFLTVVDALCLAPEKVIRS